MTNNEAIEWLIGIQEHEGEDIPIYDEDVEAIDKAIDALKANDGRKAKCWWQSPTEAMSNTLFKTSCLDSINYSKGSVPCNLSYQRFRFCPWCGGRIQWVKEDREMEDYFNK